MDLKDGASLSRSTLQQFTDSPSISFMGGTLGSSSRHITGRVEFCVLAVSRHRFKSCEIAEFLGKGRNSVTRWLNQGLRKEHDDPLFAARLDALDSAISRR